jgi:altered-inheritance-of-mitochondria protein 13
MLHRRICSLANALLFSLAQTDASRARLVEDKVQARVAEELKQLQQAETEALNRAHERLAAYPTDAEDKSPSRFTLGKEVEELRRKLDERKQLRSLPDSVESARSDVVRCLRDNDRRPLDCWQEVENFKAEVKKLETTWVSKVAS